MDKRVGFEEISNWQEYFHAYITGALTMEYGILIEALSSSLFDTTIRFPINTPLQITNAVKEDVHIYTIMNPIPSTSYTVRYDITDIIFTPQEVNKS